MAEYNARAQQWMTTPSDFWQNYVQPTTTGIWNNGYYTKQQALNNMPVFNGIGVVTFGSEEQKEKFMAKDTRKFKYALYDEDAGFVGVYETEDEAVRVAQKGLAANNGKRYTVFLAQFLVDAKPVETVRTEIK